MDNKSGVKLSPLIPYILAGCTAVSVLSTDLLTPSIPSLPEALGTDIHAAQMTVGVNLAAYSVAQLVHGPLSDRFGRRKLLIWAFVFFALVSAACSYATSIEALLAGRFVQGLFSSVPSVVIVLIIRELYGSQDALRVMALYGAALGAAPAIGPLVGGYLHVWYGWTAGFWAITLLAAFMAAAFAVFVPESQPEKREKPQQSAVVTYMQLLRHKSFLCLALALALSFGAYYAYVSTAPVIFISNFGLPENRYGLTYIVVIVAFILGNVLAARLSKIWTGQRMLVVAMRTKIVAISILLLASILSFESITVILSSMVVFAIGFALMMAAGPIVLLDKVPDMPQGPASAMLGSLQLGAAALAGIASSAFYSGNSFSMALTMGVFVLAAAFFLMRANHCAAPVTSLSDAQELDLVD